MKMFALLGALALACIATAIPAAAQAVTDTTVSAAPWIKIIEPYAVTVLGAVSTVIIGWVAALIQRSTGITIEQKYRDSLNTALTNGVSMALSALDKRAVDVKFDVKSQVIAEAANWAATKVPDAIKALGVGSDDLAKLASAKLNLLIEAPSAATTAPLSGKATS